MEYIADLHIHSKYAMACSDALTPENIAATADEKGIGIIGTGDFTHPRWMEEIKSKLSEDGTGLLKPSWKGSKARFVLSSEVCTIFDDGKGKIRKIHTCMLAPTIEVAEQVSSQLSKFGSLDSDGRPALSNLSAAELVEILHSVSSDIFIFPAHIWTPWFGALGSFSGFDSIEEAYKDQAKHIMAYETGLSSDPKMNWTVSRLDKYAMISGSDAHSLPKIGREAVLLELDGESPSFAELAAGISGRKSKLTIEFYPEEGKYHFDGHRNCGVSLAPEKSIASGSRCPKCSRRLTIGVLHRVNELSDREYGQVPPGAVPYVHAIPLQEVIAYVSKKGAYTRYVNDVYKKLIDRFGSEFNVLLKAGESDISEIDPKLGKAIEIIREDKAHVIPGYDGVFGIIDIFNEAKEAQSPGMQKSITEF